MRTVHQRVFAVLGIAAALASVPAQAAAAVNPTGIDVTVPNAKVSITGTISKAGDGVVAGAFVFVLDAQLGFQVTSGATDSHGVYRIYDLANGHYLLAIDPRPGALRFQPGFYKSAGANHFTPTSGNATTINFTGTVLHLSSKATRGHSIRGRLRSQGSGSGLKQMTVGVSRSTTSSLDPFSLASTVTDTHGAFEIPGLQNGTYQLHFSRSGPGSPNVIGGCFRTRPPNNYTADCDRATDIKIKDADSSNDDSRLPAGRIVRGRVKDAGNHDLCASLSLSSLGAPVSVPTVTSCGAFRIVGVPDSTDFNLFVIPSSTPFVSGTYANNPRHWTENGSPATIHVGTSDKDLGTITPDLGHVIRGHLRDRHHEPIKNGNVTAIGNDSNMSATTAADGSFTIRGVGSGTHRISANGGGFGSTNNVRIGYYKDGAPGNYTSDFSQATYLTANADHHGIDITLPDGYTVSGRITNHAHGGVPATIIATPFSAGASIMVTGSDSHGDYKLVALEPGTYLVFVLPSGTAPGGPYRTGYYAKSKAGHFAPDPATATTIHVGP